MIQGTHYRCVWAKKRRPICSQRLAYPSTAGNQHGPAQLDSACSVTAVRCWCWASSVLNINYQILQLHCRLALHDTIDNCKTTKTMHSWLLHSYTYDHMKCWHIFRMLRTTQARPGPSRSTAAQPSFYWSNAHLWNTQPALQYRRYSEITKWVIFEVCFFKDGSRKLVALMVINSASWCAPICVTSALKLSVDCLSSN